MRQQTGSGLLGVMIAIAVLGVLAVITVSTMKGRLVDASTGQRAQQQVVEMETLGHAARAYAVAEGHAWDDDVTVTITPATLVAAGYLDASFAPVRGQGVYASPFHHPYIVYARRFALGDIRTVVTEGVLDEARAAAVLRGESVDTIKERVALGLATRGNAHVGVIDAQATIAQGVRTGFQKELSPWLASSGHARVALLVDFPDLDTGSDGLGGGDGAVYQNYRACNLVQPTEENPIASCPAGTVKVVAWEFCGGVFGNPDAVRASPVGEITYGKRVEIDPPHMVCQSGNESAGVEALNMLPFTQTIRYTEANWCRIGTEQNPRAPRGGGFGVGNVVREIGVAHINGYPFQDLGCLTTGPGTQTVGAGGEIGCAPIGSLGGHGPGWSPMQRRPYGGYEAFVVPGRPPSGVTRRAWTTGYGQCDARVRHPVIRAHGEGNAWNALCCVKN